MAEEIGVFAYMDVRPGTTTEFTSFRTAIAVLPKRYGRKNRVASCMQGSRVRMDIPVYCVDNPARVNIVTAINSAELEHKKPTMLLVLAPQQNVFSIAGRKSKNSSYLIDEL